MHLSGAQIFGNIYELPEVIMVDKDKNLEFAAF